MTSQIKIIHFEANSQNLESWVAMINDDVVGHIFMLVEKDNRLKFMDAWVKSDHRRTGIYRKLWETRWEYVKTRYQGWTAYAWCKEKSLPLLLEKGFEEIESSTLVEKQI